LGEPPKPAREPRALPIPISEFGVNSPAATGASTAGEIRVQLFLDKPFHQTQSQKHEKG
jgi:hypothetical protein